MGAYHTQNLENIGKFLKIEKKFDFNEGEGNAIYSYNTHNSLIQARQRLLITPIFQKMGPL